MAGLLTPDHSLADDPVALVLREWASAPWLWTRDNCALSVLRHVEAVQGRRLCPEPVFATRSEAVRLLKSHGGLAAVSRCAMAQLGCMTTITPARGDVGLVELAAGLTACICLGQGAAAGPDVWAARGDGEVVVQAGEAVLAWHVPGYDRWRLPCPRP